ncbi:MAG: hypothetical protein Q7J29_12540 [Stagnimonas sp.]|nr:hypothetical protein [Stagnimonas sp.]
MIFIVIFLAGMAAGAGLAYHFAGVAALKLRLAELERTRASEPPQ